MSNNIFQFNRFSKLVVRNLKNNPKSWVLSIAVFTGLPLLFFTLSVANIGINTSDTDRATLLSLFMRLALMFSPFVLFFNYNHPKKGLTDVMLPASITEKYAVMQLSSLIFAPLTILVLFGGMDSLLALIFPKIYGGFAVPEALNDFISVGTLTQEVVVLQAVLFCNLLFIRRKILKTTGLFILSLIVFITLFGIGIAIFDSNSPFTENTESISLDFSSRGLFEIHVNDNPIVITIQAIRIFLQVILPISLATGSYFLMKTNKY